MIRFDKEHSYAIVNMEGLPGLDKVRWHWLPLVGHFAGLALNIRNR